MSVILWLSYWLWVIKYKTSSGKKLLSYYSEVFSFFTCSMRKEKYICQRYVHNLIIIQIQCLTLLSRIWQKSSKWNSIRHLFEDDYKFDKTKGSRKANLAECRTKRFQFFCMQSIDSRSAFLNFRCQLDLAECLSYLSLHCLISVLSPSEETIDFRTDSVVFVPY